MCDRVLDKTHGGYFVETTMQQSRHWHHLDVFVEEIGFTLSEQYMQPVIIFPSLLTTVTTVN